MACIADTMFTITAMSWHFLLKSTTSRASACFICSHDCSPVYVLNLIESCWPGKEKDFTISLFKKHKIELVGILL